MVGVSCWVARHGSVGMLTDPNILLHDRIQGLHWLQVGGRRARGTARRRVSPFLMGAFFERASICPRVALVWSRTGATQRRSTQLHWLSVETALRIDCAEPGCHGWWRVHSRHQYQQVTYGGGGVQLVQAQSLGYFLADTAADLLAPASFSWAFFLHHVLTGAHMTISGFRLGGTVISALFLLIEVSTPLNNLRWRLRASKRSALERAVATAFAVTVFVARLSCFVPVIHVAPGHRDGGAPRRALVYAPDRLGGQRVVCVLDGTSRGLHEEEVSDAGGSGGGGEGGLMYCCCCGRPFFHVPVYVHVCSCAHTRPL